MPCAADASCTQPAAADACCASCRAALHAACARGIAGTRDATGNGDWILFCSLQCSSLAADAGSGEPVAPIFGSEEPPRSGDRTLYAAPAPAPVPAPVPVPAPAPAPEHPAASAPAPAPAAAAAAAAPEAAACDGSETPPVRSTSAAASSAAKYRSRSVFKPEHGLRYGMAVHERDASGVVLSVACQFCVAFGRTRAADSAAKKRKVSKTNKVFKHPFRTDLFQRHLMEHHQERWTGYRELTGGEKEVFFAAVLHIAGTVVTGGVVKGEGKAALGRVKCGEVKCETKPALVLPPPATPGLAPVPAAAPAAAPPPVAAPPVAAAGVAAVVKVEPASASTVPQPAAPAAEALYLSSDEFSAALAKCVVQNANKRFSAEQQAWLPALLTANCKDFHLPTEVLYGPSPDAGIIASSLLKGRMDGKAEREDGLFHLFVGMVEAVRSRHMALKDWLGPGVV